METVGPTRAQTAVLQDKQLCRSDTLCCSRVSPHKSTSPAQVLTSADVAEGKCRGERGMFIEAIGRASTVWDVEDQAGQPVRVWGQDLVASKRTQTQCCAIYAQDYIV